VSGEAPDAAIGAEFMNIWTYVPWRVLGWMDRLLPNVCWAHVVMRKQGYETAENPIFRDWICRYDEQQCGRCYCGKYPKELRGKS